MFLKKLELQGFKSFAEKTILDFNGRVIAIVGPNGSGKSNVTDAMRWLLGEREAKNLRSEKTEDLIFAGTQKRPRAGLAQASLYIDNQSGFFPIDFKEIVVSREADRGGTTKFSLNKAEVRLKDIVDFFAKSRLGARGLTTVSQGESDAFIKASPIDRRLMVEEILGLKEFRLKKSEAERRLKTAELNMGQARALIDELKPHLNFLRRQTARYENREKLVSDLIAKENEFYGRRLRLIEEGRAKIGSYEKDALAREEQIKKTVAAAEINLNEVKESEPQANSSLKEIKLRREALTGRKSHLEKELGRALALKELSRQSEIPSLKLAEAMSEIKKVVELLLEEIDLAKLKDGLKKILALAGGGVTESPKEDPAEEEEIDLQIGKIDIEIASLNEAESGFSKDLTEFNFRFRKAFTNLEEAKARLSALQGERNKIDLEKERLNLRFGDLTEEIKSAGRELSEFRIHQSAELWGEGEIRGDLGQEIFKLRREVSAIGEIDEGLVKEAAETEERHRFLAGQVGDLEKSVEDLKKLIVDLEKEIHDRFYSSLKTLSEEFDKFIKLLFGGGAGRLALERAPAEEGADSAELGAGVLVDVSLPKKRIKNLEALSGGERSLVSVAALFALVAVSPPPFLVLDEIDSNLDEKNARRLGEIIRQFAKETQFILVTHNRALMEAADVLYGVTMAEDGASRILSLKLS